MGEKVVVDRGEFDRLVLMRMDLDRYEAQLIPDLHQRVNELTDVLEQLVEAVQDLELQPSSWTQRRQRATFQSAVQLLEEHRAVEARRRRSTSQGPANRSPRQR